MPSARFESRLRVDPRRCVIELGGQIDGGAKAALVDAYDQAAASPAILLNFSDVDYINSTGIALIVGLLARARADGRPLGACGLSDHYREIFEITRLSDFMPIYPDEATALSDEEVNRR